MEPSASRGFQVSPIVLIVFGVAVLAVLWGMNVRISRALTTVNTYEVNSTADALDNDPTDGICMTAGGVCTLRAAIMEANFATGPNTITLPSGIYVLTRPGYDDGALVGDLDITHWLTIQGAGAGVTIIDGNGAVTGDRVFQVLNSAVDVTLKGMTIRNGSVPASGVGGASWGGGILVNNTGVSSLILQLSDVILEGNSALTGAGLYASTSTVDMQNTTVRANATVSGGAGGGIYDAFGGTLAIRDSHVYSNSASIGGGVALEGNLNARIERSEFYSNTASVDGGAISNSSTFDYPLNPLTLYDSNLHDNFAGFNGGAISTYSTLVLSRTVLAANHALYNGGGIWITLSDVSPSLLQESTLSRNTAQFGGGIYNDASVGATGALRLLNSTVSGNVVTHDGAGIYAIGAARILLYNDTIASNVLSRLHLQTNLLRGGGVFITDTAVITAQNTLIADNYYTDNLTKVIPDDCFATVTSLHSLGYNLIETISNCLISGTTFGNVTGQDPNLAPLTIIGGPSATAGQMTPVRLPQPGSPAIDAGDMGGCTNGQSQPLSSDQRRFRRPIGARCDIGSVEVSPYGADLPLIGR